MAINLVLYKKVNYDAIKDFVPVPFYVKSKYLAAEREKWGKLVKDLGLEGSQ